jgi:hypothetical protein
VSSDSDSDVGVLTVSTNRSVELAIDNVSSEAGESERKGDGDGGNCM